MKSSVQKHVNTLQNDYDSNTFYNLTLLFQNAVRLLT